MPRRRLAIGLWLLALAVAGVVVARARFIADLSAFLPRAPTAEQQVLVDQLRDGAVSRLILVGIEGADAATRAALSRALARQLRSSPEFTAVGNGEDDLSPRQRELLFADRYLLSPAVDAERFTVQGLHAAIADSIDLLASPAGMMLKSLLTRDPTGETAHLLQQLAGNGGARIDRGVWVSRDGTRAVLLLQTAAAGFDSDGQERAIARVREDYAALPQRAGTQLQLSGPAVFAVEARRTIRNEAQRLSLLGGAVVIVLLSLAYRSPRALVLGLLPVLSGAVAGIAAVSLGFGAVHGLTLAFGTTLIGEAVDYSIYLFVQAAGADSPAERRRRWLQDYWPMVRLGMLTSVAGFAALLFSGFPGLAQLGLYSIAGIVTAALVTRHLLPELLPGGFRIRGLDWLGAALAAVVRHGARLRWTLAALLAAAVVIIALPRQAAWNPDLAALSPVGREQLALDAALRGDLGAPDARCLVLVTAAGSEAALAGAERASIALQRLVDAGVLGGYDSPARYLPSVAMQRARQAAIPQRDELARRLAVATADLPLRASRLTPFLDEVEAARQAALLQRADLAGTPLALAVDALLQQRDGRWTALLPLQAPPGKAGDIDADAVRAALAQAGADSAVFVDMKTESDRLYAGYLGEAQRLSLAGVAAIMVLLLLALRSPRRVLRIAAPLAAAVLVVSAGLLAAGVRLNILHLVGLLLVVAVGSNYALFFDRVALAGRTTAAATITSLALANAATVAGFGLLALSPVPVLQALGVTVAPGAVLALLFAAILASGPNGGEQR
jgi:predicted exporter